VNETLWYEQIYLPRDPRTILNHPWNYAGSTLVTNGSIAVLLPGAGTYQTLDKQITAILNTFMEPTLKPLKTTVEALRNWAGDFVFTRCTQCQGEGYIPCPNCKDGCNKCDDEREVECPTCKTASWAGFDHKSRGQLGEIVINLKLLAGIVNCVAPGDVELHIPEYVKGRSQKPLLIIGTAWKAVIMPMRLNDGVPFKGWIDKNG